MIINIFIFVTIKSGKMVNLNNYMVLSEVGWNSADLVNTPPSYISLNSRKSVRCACVSRCVNLHRAACCVYIYCLI